MTQPQVSSELTVAPLLQDFPSLGKNRNFILLWLSYVVSALADRVHWLVMLQLLCIVLLRQHHIGSQQTAQLNLAMFLPFLAVAPLAGILSDRWPRRSIMITADLVRAGLVFLARTVLLAGAAGHWLPLTTLLILLFGSEIILSSVGEFFYVARAAILPNLVHPRQLLQANAMITTAGTIFSLLGFIAGGVLVAWRLDYALYVDGAAFLLSAGGLALMRPPRPLTAGKPLGEPASPLGEPAVEKAAATAEGRSTSPGKLWRDIGPGVAYLRRHKRPFQVIGLEMVFFTISSVVFNSLPSILTQRFHLPPQDFGIFMGLAGAGMVAGAAAISQARQGIPKELGIAWSTVLMGGSLLLASWASHWEMLLAYLVSGAFFGAIMFSSVDTLLQRVVPDYVRGRVMAVRDMATTLGLVVMTVPMAMWPNVDAYVHDLVVATAYGTAALGAVLVVLYMRRQPLPLRQAFLLRLISMYIRFWHRWRLAGACRIPATGAAIVAANHTSTLDPLLLLLASRRRLIRFMVDRASYRLPAIGPLVAWSCRLDGAIPVDRSGHDPAAILVAVRALREGSVVGIFPEGALSVDHVLRAPELGVAMLALLSGAPVVPVYIHGTRRHRSLADDYFRRANVRVYFGAPLRFDEWRSRHREREVLQHVAETIMQAIMNLKRRAEDGAHAR